MLNAVIPNALVPKNDGNYLVHAFVMIFAFLPALAVAQPLIITADTKVSNTYRWLDGKTSDLGGLVLDGKDVVTTRNVIRFWDDGDSNTVVKNARFTLAKPPINPRDLPVALEYVGGHDHLIENVIAENFRSTPIDGKYENGDCFSGERKASRITFRNTIARNCSDGGYDFKSIDVRYENATAEDVGKGWRVWGTATASTITCRRWRDGCIQTNPGTAAHPTSFIVDKLVLEPDEGSTAVTFGVNKGSTLTVSSCAGKLSGGNVIYWQPGATSANTNVTLCGVKVANQTDDELRAEIQAAMGQPAVARREQKNLCTFKAKLLDRSGNGVIELGRANAERCGGKAGLRVKVLSESPGRYVYGRAE